MIHDNCRLRTKGDSEVMQPRDGCMTFRQAEGVQVPNERGDCITSVATIFQSHENLGLSPCSVLGPSPPDTQRRFGICRSSVLRCIIKRTQIVCMEGPRLCTGLDAKSRNSGFRPCCGILFMGFLRWHYAVTRVL